jgi:two-component system chemotaxis response regulator CheB
VVQTVKIPSSYTPTPRYPSAPVSPDAAGSFRGVKIVAIGASTGGPQALHTILSQLPPKFPVPVVCVQHISEGFLKGLVDWLGSECHLPVKIAPAGERPQPGIIYFPPEQKHLEFDNQGRFLYSSMGPVSGHRPSVTVTFNAVAKCYRRAALGILLTGMGRDGADGMLELFKQGGITIAQNEASSVVFGMPREAIALSAAQYILPITEIAPMLLHRLMGDRH